jgi:WD40 repeat protein
LARVDPTADPEERAEADTNPARPDVFVSYSRHDRAFVDEQLLPALVAHDLDAWVDLEDIPPASDWQERVFRGIDAAKAFLVVLSPDSLGSAVCRAELGRALAGNKRLIPILRRDVAGSEMPPELEQPNWILFRDEDDPAAAVDRLVEALTTDLDWRDMHARVAERAHEWERAGKDSSFLLRGSDLSTAERWLADQAGHAEKATALQTAYLVRSRQGATRRQRIVLGATVASLVVIAGLGVLALLQRDEARTQRAHAEAETRVAQAQTRLALSRELATDSGESLRLDRPDTALLLSAQAATFNPSAEARQALWNALGAVPQLGLLLRAGAGVPMGFADGGGLLVTNDAVWDVAKRRIARSLQTNVVAASGDGWFLATGPAGTFRVLAPSNTAQTIGRLDAENGYRAAAAIAPGGNLVAVAARGSRHVILLDRRSGTRRSLAVPQQDTDTPIIGPLAFNGDGTVLLAAGIDGVPLLFDTRSGRRIGTLRGEDVQGAVDVAADPVDPQVVGIVTNFGVSLWNVRTQRELGPAFQGRLNMYTAAFSGDGTVLAGGGDDGVVFWNVATRRELPGSWSLAQPVTALVAAPGRARFASGGAPWVHGAGELALWDLDGGSRLVRRLRTTLRSGWAVAFSPDGSRLAAAGGNGVSLWKTSTAALVHVRPAKLLVDTRLAFSPDGRSIAVSEQGGLRILRADTLAPVGPPMSYETLDPEVAPRAAAFAPDGRRVAAGYQRDVLLWSPSTHTHGGPAPYSTPAAEQGVTGMAYSPGGGTLAVSGYHGLALWPGDRVSGAPARIDTSTAYQDVAFDGAGTELVAADGSKLTLFEAAPLRRIVQSIAAPGGAVGVAFSRDGRTVAAAGVDGVSLWSADGLRLLGWVSLVRTTQAGGAGVAFSPDGRRLAFASGTTIGMVDASVSSWVRTACEVVNRGLTRAEWAQYVGAAAPYAPVCRS